MVGVERGSNAGDGAAAMNADLFAKAVENAARIRMAEPGIGSLTYDDLSPEQREQLHEWISPGVRAVFATVADHAAKRIANDRQRRNEWASLAGLVRELREDKP